MQTLYANDLGALNQSWQTRYRSFREVGPFIATMLKDETGLALKGDRELKRHLDYFRFNMIMPPVRGVECQSLPQTRGGCAGLP